MIVYIQFAVSVHGLNAHDEDLTPLAEQIHSAVEAVLLEERNANLHFRNEFYDDIEVTITEKAGS
jgi:hypothetical protein